MKTFVIILLILGGLTFGGWLYFRKGAEDAPQYTTVAVTRGDIIQAVTATGTLNPVVNVQVGSQISGNIQKLFADFNSEVKKGDVVAQLDPSTYQAIVHQAEGDLASAEAALSLAELNAKRQRELHDSRIATQADLDNADVALRQAKAAVQIRTAALEKAKVDLGRCTIYAPIDGVVISRNVDVGQTVAASLQAPVVFVIANDLRKMQIDTNVAEADVGNVEVGQTVTFTVDAFPYRTFRGKVAQVRNAPITVQNVVTYDTIVEVDNEDLKLKPGMTANVSIVISERQDALKLPNAALRYRGPDAQKGGPPGGSGSPGGPGNAPGGATAGGPPAAEASGSASPGNRGGPRTGGGNGQRGERRGGSGGPGGGQHRHEPGAPVERTVYVLANGQPQPVKVKLGITDSITTEVIEGLKEGDQVVTGTNAPSADSDSANRGGNSPFGRRRF